jgi:muconolactone delta-isomerase
VRLDRALRRAWHQTHDGQRLRYRSMHVDGKAVQHAGRTGQTGAPMVLSVRADDGTVAAQLPISAKTNEIPMFARCWTASTTSPTPSSPNLEESGKVVDRYHIVGYHGGAWIFNVESNDELEMLLAQAPVYNFSHFDVYPLADMSSLPVVPPEQ